MSETSSFDRNFKVSRPNPRFDVYNDSLNKHQPLCKRTEIIRDGRKFPVFQKPSVIGVFSIDSKRKFLLDASQIKYLYWTQSSDEVHSKKVNFDLNEGITNAIRKDEQLNEKLDQIFNWIHLEGNQREECTVGAYLSKCSLLN